MSRSSIDAHTVLSHKLHDRLRACVLKFEMEHPLNPTKSWRKGKMMIFEGMDAASPCDVCSSMCPVYARKRWLHCAVAKHRGTRSLTHIRCKNMVGMTNETVDTSRNISKTGKLHVWLTLDLNLGENLGATSLVLPPDSANTASIGCHKYSIL